MPSHGTSHSLPLKPWTTTHFRKQARAESSINERNSIEREEQDRPLRLRLGRSHKSICCGEGRLASGCVVGPCTSLSFLPKGGSSGAPAWWNGCSPTPKSQVDRLAGAPSRSRWAWGGGGAEKIPLPMLRWAFFFIILTLGATQLSLSDGKAARRPTKELWLKNCADGGMSQ